MGASLRIALSWLGLSMAPGRGAPAEASSRRPAGKGTRRPALWVLLMLGPGSGDPEQWQRNTHSAWSLLCTMQPGAGARTLARTGAGIALGLQRHGPSNSRSGSH
jgi:hypothetical protein